MKRLSFVTVASVAFLTGCGGPPECNDRDVKNMLSLGISNELAKSLSPYIGRKKDDILQVLRDKYPVKISNVLQVEKADKNTGSTCEATASIDFKGHPFPQNVWYSFKYSGSRLGCDVEGTVISCKVSYKARKTLDSNELMVSWDQPEFFARVFSLQEANGMRVFISQSSQ